MVFFPSLKLVSLKNLVYIVFGDKKVVVTHHGSYNDFVYYRLSHDVST